MKIIINNIFNNEQIETLHLENFNNIDESFKKLSPMKGTLEANILTIDEPINSYIISKIKNNLNKIHINSFRIYSNSREVILAGKSLKIDSTFIKEHEVKKKLLLLDSKKKNGVLHEGTVRSGNRIFSNGNLFIIGDVNPGAIVSAKKNIYVWGKLLGIAYAGKGGDNNASIASLYLHPLQLRIADVIAIGPKDKPKNFYPEIAVIDKETINIKPYLMDAKNNQ